jgi:type IV pilus assembly protein PilC
MPVFKYTAVEEKTGKKIKSTMEAANKTEVYTKVREGGARVTTVKQKGKFSIDFSGLSSRLSTVGENEKIRFAHNLSSMLKAGLTTTRAISVMKRQIRNPRFVHILVTIEKNITEGKTLHDSLEQFPRTFSPLFIAMVRAGEESGTLTDSLKIISEQMEQAYQLKKRIRGAMIYPAVIMFVMFGIAMLMLLFIVPTLQSTFEDIGVDLPPATQFVIDTSDFVQNYPIVVIGGFIMLVLLVVLGKRTKTGGRIFEFGLIRIPVIGGLAKEVNAARTARTMSSLLTSGVSMLHAIAITRDVLQNSYYKDVMTDAGTRVEKGENFSKILIENDKLYPIFVGEMASVGEETGDISTMLKEVAEFYEEDVNARTKDMSTIIEPILMVIIGIGVGFFAYAMLMPIYSLMDSI